MSEFATSSQCAPLGKRAKRAIFSSCHTLPQLQDLSSKTTLILPPIARIIDKITFLCYARSFMEGCEKPLLYAQNRSVTHIISASNTLKRRESVAANQYNVPIIDPGMKTVWVDGPDQWDTAMKVMGFGLFFVMCSLGIGAFAHMPAAYGLSAALFVVTTIVVSMLLDTASKVYIPLGHAGITLGRDSSGKFVPILELLMPGMYRRWPGKHRRVFFYGLESGEITVSDIPLSFGMNDTFNIAVKVKIHAIASLNEAIDNFTARWQLWKVEGLDHAHGIAKIVKKHVKAKVESLGLDLIRDPSGPTGGAARLLAELSADTGFATEIQAIDGRLVGLEFVIKPELATQVYGKEPFITSKDRPVWRAVENVQGIIHDTSKIIDDTKALAKDGEKLVGKSKDLVKEAREVIVEIRNMQPAAALDPAKHQELVDAVIALSVKCTEVTASQDKLERKLDKFEQVEEELRESEEKLTAKMVLVHELTKPRQDQNKKK